MEVFLCIDWIKTNVSFRGRLPLSVIKGEHLLVEGGAVRLTVVDTNL